MSLFARLFNGLTESTPQQIQLDAGAFFKNFDPKTDTYADAKSAGKCLGATQGGGTITIKPTFRQISVDGAFGRVKGLADVGAWECSISATLIETTAENLRLGIGVASIEKSTTPTGYNIIKGKSGIEDSDFVENITWIGKLAGSDKPLMFIIKNGLNEVVDRSLVIWIRTGSHSVGDDRANGDGVVAHHFCHTLKCGALHFIVGDVAAFVFKLLDALVEFWFSKWQAHFTTLWTVEAHSRDGVASHHVVAADFFNQSWV